MFTKLGTLILMLIGFNLSAQNLSESVSSKSYDNFGKGSYKLAKNQYLSVQYMGLTYHPGGGAVNMVKNYPLKFDKKANFVLNIGIAANYDYELNNRFFLRAEASYYMDCAYKKAGYIHTAIHYKVANFGRHSFNIGVGPVFTVREDWHIFEDYKDTDIYGKRVSNGWQYRLFPVGGEVEYRYKINEDLEFQYSVIPAYPAVITSKFGLRWKL
jgi:hypothetical protein